MIHDQTKSLLIEIARELFAKQGFRGTTIRAITERAGTNLGAVTYHFGSKLALYHEVVERATQPMREHLRGLDLERTSALEAIGLVIRGMFGFLAKNPDVPSLVMQQLMTSDPLPPAAKNTIGMALGSMTALIERGQQDGSIRSGPPRYMAVSFALIPMAQAIYRRSLREAAGIDNTDPAVRAAIEHQVITLIRRGLAAAPAPDGEAS
jgi:AcrR family transcriptional regulator